ncbi:polysaccharide biosynthesis/export family protein [Novosphingobium sp. BL-8H]|uniref:polysaccharide biosynthesis/export family protein n=1 Tax=Novosphingobium sp. BL-8H TaxID=3127640 RepID=UPI003756AC05
MRIAIDPFRHRQRIPHGLGKSLTQSGRIALIAPFLASACLTSVCLAPPVMAQQPSTVAEAAAVGGAVPAPLTGLAGPRYTVNAGDELDVFVWGEDRMQRAVRVQPDGTFAFPLAGTIRASGRNVSDIAGEIRERISLNYRGTVPDVTVSVREATGMRFYVVGKVRSPGSFTSGTAPNILQALSMAGGTADFADVKNAVILRQTPQGEVVEPVALNKLLKGRRALEAGGLDKPLPTLSSGDVLVIP